MSAVRLTPALIRRGPWSFEALFRLAEECRDPEEAQAILDAFRAKKGHERRMLQLLNRGGGMMVTHYAAVHGSLP